MSCRDGRRVVPDLTAAEQLVWEAFPDGAQVDLTGARDRDVRAVVIAALLRGARAADPGLAPAVRLCGIRVTGALDLSGAVTQWPLHAEQCAFTGPVRLVEAVTRGVRLVACELPSLDGTSWHADGVVDLSGAQITRGLRLERARVAGALIATGGRFGADGDGVALAADGLAAAGGIRLDGSRTTGAVHLRGSHVDGPLDLGGAELGDTVLDGMVLEGRLLGRGLAVSGRLSLFNATVTGSVQLSGAALRNPGGVALGAGGATIRGAVWCGAGFESDGELRFIGAELRANLTLASAVLRNPAGTALNLDRAAIGDIDARGVVVDGGLLSLTGARIGDRLNLAGARLTHGRDLAVLAADGAEVGGSVLLSEAVAGGEIRFRGGTVEGGLVLDGTRLHGPAVAADLSMVRAAELVLLPAEPVQGLVSLAHAKFGLIVDDPARWPALLVLDGLAYTTLDPQLPVSDRLRWLDRGRGGPLSQPYEQLAAHYGRMGRPADARRVLLERERRQHASAAFVSRVWGALQDVSVGYGFRPWRAALCLCALLAAGSTVFAEWPPAPLKPSEAPHFNPVFYCLDLLVPIVDLGQEHAFNPAGPFQWLSYGLVAAGWILATTVAAGVARAVSRP